MRVDRLMNVVRALREKKDPAEFNMRMVMHECGTPACCMGEYASREDLQNEFSLAKVNPRSWWEAVGIVERNSPQRMIQACGERVANHFDISVAEAEELFNSDGCCDAQTPEEAALYIERFLKRKRLEALDEMVSESESMGLYEVPR